MEEQNLKHCSVVLEPITDGNILTVEANTNTIKCPATEDNENGTLRHNLVENPKRFRTGKNVTYKLPEKCESVTPCFVELENINISNDDNHYKKLNDVTYTPQRKKLLPETEPITPKANIEFSIELKKVINERNILTSVTKKHVFEALDEIKNKTEEDRRQFKREKALLEIISSETKYVHQLEIIINFFMKPTKERKLLKHDDYNILFGNINTIYNINRELLGELVKGVENVARAFSKIAPFFKLYSVYAYDFKSSLKILQNARLLNPQFASFMENQETRPEVQNKLSALLITPIQRVPRYKLLLTTLYNLTKPSQKDFNSLTDCLDKIEDAAEHINKIVEDQENMQRLLEFQRCLRGEPNVITPGRKLVKEGILTKMCSKNAHSEKLYVVLMNDIIMFNKMKKDEPKVNSLKCLSIFPLNKCKIVEILDKGCLKVVCQDEELILYHSRFSETKIWIQQIKDAIDDHLKDRKTLRKESSARRPVKRKDLHEYNEIGLSPGKPLKKRRFDVDTEPTNSGPSHKILKRRPIGSISEEMSGPKNSLAAPAFSSNPSDNENEVLENSQQVSELAKDLYVFGKPNNNDPGFKFGKFIGDVGSTIKRFLGFKN